MKLTIINEEHIARIAGKEHKVGFREAKRLASRLGATRFEYDNIVWVFRGGRWNISEAL